MATWDSTKYIIRTFTILYLALFTPTVVYAVEQEENIEFIIKKAIQQVNIKNVEKTISYLQGFGNRRVWEKQWEAARWTADELKKSGMEVDLQQYEFKGRLWLNVVAKVEGRNKTDEIIIAVAHLDSISDNPEGIAPGADDNASGVAVLMETARILKNMPVDRTIIFCFFTNEETGTAGSKNYVKQLRKGSNHVLAVINLDILGYNRPNFPFYLNALMSHYSYKHKIKALYRMGSNYLNGFINGRDVIKIAGRKSDELLVNLTSGLFINSFYANPFEHSTQDRIEKIDLKLLEKINKAMMATIISLANN